MKQAGVPTGKNGFLRLQKRRLTADEEAAQQLYEELERAANRELGVALTAAGNRYREAAQQVNREFRETCRAQGLLTPEQADDHLDRGQPLPEAYTRLQKQYEQRCRAIAQVCYHEESLAVAAYWEKEEMAQRELWEMLYPSPPLPRAA